MNERFTLRELRERHEWTQEKLAKIAEVDIDIIKDIETGKPVNWAIAARISVKVKEYVGKQAIEGLDIPQSKD